MAIVILVLVLLGALLIVPLGLPGTWVMVGAALVYHLAVRGTVGMATVAGTAVLALIGELLEFGLAARYAKKYGGSRRAGWAAIAGGLVGAFVGVPVPVVGPVIGAFLGAFLGALAGELSAGSDHRTAGRVATGALLGRVAAAAMKVGLGAVMAVWIVIAALA
ncbi:MAG: DUF456 domain-containing protein [Gemmatimonadota bacterium]|nr:DUF456 domain-containing protein [Gemmatimonadota bacterium]